MPINAPHGEQKASRVPFPCTVDQIDPAQIAGRDEATTQSLDEQDLLVDCFINCGRQLNWRRVPTPIGAVVEGGKKKWEEFARAAAPSLLAKVFSHFWERCRAPLAPGDLINCLDESGNCWTTQLVPILSVGEAAGQRMLEVDLPAIPAQPGLPGQPARWAHVPERWAELVDRATPRDLADGLGKVERGP